MILAFYMNKSLFLKHKRTFSVTDIELVTKLIASKSNVFA